ncbi:MAG: hypothetical protein Q9191_005903 [Dirinaria sp. TL-2023a]
MATEAPLPSSSSIITDLSQLHPALTSSIPVRRPPPPAAEVLTTVYSFPFMEPLRFANYPATHLHLPLRRDILHRAVVFEGDAARQGTAHAKYRAEVRGSNRKIRPQKGTGMARLGDKKSPMLRGGGHAFGKHARDLSSKLPRKIYDLAWRTALSYRYRRGELVIVDKIIDLEEDVDERWVPLIFKRNGWARENGRSLIISRDPLRRWKGAMDERAEYGAVFQEGEVDVKDLLGMGRLIVEKRSLDAIIKAHISDLGTEVARATYD